MIDGQPPGETGKIHFTPIAVAEGYAKRPATGAFGADGVYQVMSWAPGDGLVPGSYTMNVMPGSPSNSKILNRYHDNGTSGLKLEVPVDQGSIEYDFELSSK